MLQERLLVDFSKIFPKSFRIMLLFSTVYEFKSPLLILLLLFLPIGFVLFYRFLFLHHFV